MQKHGSLLWDIKDLNWFAVRSLDITVLYDNTFQNCLKKDCFWPVCWALDGTLQLQHVDTMKKTDERFIKFLSLSVNKQLKLSKWATTVSFSHPAQYFCAIYVHTKYNKFILSHTFTTQLYLKVLISWYLYLMTLLCFIQWLPRLLNLLMHISQSFIPFISVLFFYIIYFCTFFLIFISYTVY